MPRYPGGLIRKTPVTPTGPLQSGSAPGMWTLAEATYWTKQGLWPIAGNFLAVEDVFSTYLYTGNASTQTITNGIDLAGKGGMIWTKARNVASYGAIVDTVRGSGYSSQTTTSGELITWDTGSPGSNSGWRYSDISSFNSNGYSLGYITSTENAASNSYVSWTFRKAAKFFDVVTYTGNGASPRQIAHSLGVAPGCIIVKATSGTGWWRVYHRSRGSGEAGALQNTNAFVGDSVWGYTDPTTTSFYVSSDLNDSGTTYVAYLFAHDATADGIIQCGSYTGTGAAGNFVSLGWEPQWVLIKRASGGTGDWRIIDNMRGLVTSTTNGDATLNANTSEAEFNDATVGNYPFAAANPTGFTLEATSGPSNASGSTYIYIAIRRGPMKTPTVGTSVFNPSTSAGSAGTVITTGFPVDMQLIAGRTTTANKLAQDRLRGVSSTTTESAALLYTNLTNAENVAGGARAWDNTGFQLASTGWAGSSAVYWSFRRAPGFFDVVCYTGTGAARTVNHNLGVAPELMIVKNRTSAGSNWAVYSATLGAGNWLTLNTTNGSVSTTLWSSTAPTSTVFSVSSDSQVNGSGANYVAYLFASCPGVSKVGSYTGNGSSQTINCGFTNGARFFLVKRTDDHTGDWWVYDSARGIVAAADPALRLNSTAAEVTSADAVDTDSTGIIVNQEATCNINVNGATYIFLAIA